MDPIPAFELFPDPVGEGVFEQSADGCDLCGRRRGWLYTGPRSGGTRATDEFEIRPWCIADGSAAARGFSFNDATNYLCDPSNPKMPTSDIELVEQRTPGFMTWQHGHWLMCCGRACNYLGEADAADLRGRWASAVPSMFADDDRPQDEIDDIVDNVKRAAGPCAYVFQCQVCRSLSGFWDIH